MSRLPNDDIGSASGLLITGIFAVALLLGGFGAWAVMSQIGGAIIAQGQVEVEQNRQVIQHPDGGVVKQVHFREGDSVEAGDLLITLDATDLVSELAVVEGKLFEVLARNARLDAERDGAEVLDFDEQLLASGNPIAAELMQGQQRLFEVRLETVQSEIEQLLKQKQQIADQIEGIKSQQESVQNQIELIAEELTGQEALLERGLTQAQRVLALRREEAALTGRAGEYAAAIATAEGRKTELDISILRIRTDLREQAIATLRDLQFNEIELSERRQQILSQLKRLEIRSPVSGVIYDARVFGPEAVILGAEPVMYIVPQDRPLVITARVRPQDIDEVVLNQQVRVRFSAFNQRTTPELKGSVVQVSADAFVDSSSSQSYYRVDVSLVDGETDLLPEGRALIPGMPVDIFVTTSDRTPMEYLLKPISDYLAKTFRET